MDLDMCATVFCSGTFNNSLWALVLAIWAGSISNIYGINRMRT